MKESWTGEVVKRLHLSGHTCRELAVLTGYSEPYISMLLNGKKTGTDWTRQNIFRALAKLEENEANFVIRVVSTSDRL